MYFYFQMHHPVQMKPADSEKRNGEHIFGKLYIFTLNPYKQTKQMKEKRNDSGIQHISVMKIWSWKYFYSHSSSSGPRTAFVVLLLFFFCEMWA